MDVKEILKITDHTLLRQDANEEEITKLCSEALLYGVKSVCVPPCYIELCKNILKDKVLVCTVIGFPNGYGTTEAKCFEAADASKKGADEIDMVVNITDIKNKNRDKILSEINKIKQSCNKTLKVIIETCLLTEDEKIKMCQIINESEADFIKTSTGFSKAGATEEDIILFKKHCIKKIKAAGGINSLEDAIKFIELGADRLGSSKIVKLVKGDSKNDSSY